MLINGKECKVENFKFKVKHYMALSEKGINFFKFMGKLTKYYETQDLGDIPTDEVISFLEVVLGIECGITIDDLKEVEFWDLFTMVTDLFPNNATTPKQSEKKLGE